MAAGDNRFIVFWASHERRARIYGWLLVVALALLAVAEVNTYRAWHREREVVRIGCDGIPQLVRVNDQIYSEPDEREIRAFAAEFVTLYMRADSYSIVNDVQKCMRQMTTDLSDAYRKAMRGTATAPGAITQIEALKRRTQIDPNALDLAINKKVYPWRVDVKGIRQIVGQEEGQPFEVSLGLYRLSRDEDISGLVVASVKVSGPPLPAAEVTEPKT